MTPTREESMRQLERVLASTVFAGSSRLSRFLRFVGERSIAGEGDRLKEYVVGVEVFDRDERYDPRIDSIVRVEAGRLRTKLEQYYHGVGRNDSIVIRLEKGSYAPTFEWREGTSVASTVEREAAPASVTSITSASAPAFLSAPTSPQPSIASRRRRMARAAAATALVGALALAAAVAVSSRFVAPPPVNSVAVVPFETSAGAPEDSLIATQLTEAVTAALVRTQQFAVVPSTDARQVQRDESVRSMARRLRASWLVQARVVHEGEALRVEVRVVNPERNQKMWVETFSGATGHLDDLSHRIGQSAATAIQRRVAVQGP
jgi:TolB-like protein